MNWMCDKCSCLQWSITRVPHATWSCIHVKIYFSPSCLSSYNHCRYYSGGEVALINVLSEGRTFSINMKHQILHNALWQAFNKKLDTSGKSQRNMSSWLACQTYPLFRWIWRMCCNQALRTQQLTLTVTVFQLSRVPEAGARQTDENSLVLMLTCNYFFNFPQELVVKCI